MKTKHTGLSWAPFQWVSRWLLLACVCWVCSSFGQSVPVRLSFKFILNASGNRPASGNINTDDEVRAQVDRGNAIFSRFISELRIENIEIVDVSGISAYYTSEPTVANRDSLRSAAQGNPTLYHWRTDAVNYYINASSGSSGAAISDFPPNNNIVLVSQGAWQTTVAHELGHTLNLIHTHESDGCSDTLPDDSAWTSIDQMAVNSFGVAYSLLDASQQAQVNMTWTNLMSYHDADHRSMLSSCQMDRQSSTAYDDKDWMLSRIPVYVQAGAGIFQFGSFSLPYGTIQQAINSGSLGGKVLVLNAGTHARPSTINLPVDIITRKGVSDIQDVAVPWSLPYALEESTNPAVRNAVVKAQQCDKRKDNPGAIQSLEEAEKHATGREKSALELELGQRMRDAKRFDEAAAWFQKLADGSDQPALRSNALSHAAEMKIKAKEQQESKANGKKERPAK